MNGSAGERGYLVQTIVSLLESFQDSDHWEAFALEPKDDSEKVDIKWYFPKYTKVVQIKSSENQISLSMVKGWCVELKNSTEADDYELLLVGPCSQSVVKQKEFQGIRIPPPRPLDITGMFQQIAHRLDIYLEQKGFPPGVSPSIREIVARALITELKIHSLAGMKVSRDEFDRRLLGWISNLSSSVQEKSGDNALSPVVPAVTEDEVLVLIANFNNHSNVTFDAASRIWIALQKSLEKYDLPNVRLEHINQTFRLFEIERVKMLGKQLNATIVIWGHYDDYGVFPRFTLVQETRLTHLPENFEDKFISLTPPSEDFAFYINRELPSQMVYFTQFVLGQIHYLKDSFTEALNLLEDALESAKGINSDNIQFSLAAIHFFKGWIHGVNGDNRQTVQAYTQAIALNPNDEQAYNNRGGAYLRSGSLQQAILDFNKAIELAPTYLAAYLNRALYYGKIGKFEQAMLDYSKVIRLDANLAVIYCNRGTTLTEFGKIEQALQDFDKAIELDATEAGFFYNRGNTYSQLGNLQQAITDYNIALKLNPDFPAVYTNRGNAYSRLGDQSQAISDYSKAIEIAPNYAMPYYNRANIYADSGDIEQALLDLTKTIELNPNFASAYYHRGEIYGSIGKLNQAILDFHKVIELDPENSLALKNRGFAYASLGDHERAILDYNRVIELDPGDPRVYSNRGFAHATLGDFKQAVSDYNKAIEIDPNLATAYHNRGKAHIASGNIEEAISDLNKAAELDPNDAEVYHNRGTIYAEVGDQDKAVIDYNKAIELDPSLIAAYFNRGRLFR